MRAEAIGRPAILRWRRVLTGNAGLLIVLLLLVVMLAIGAAMDAKFRSFGNLANVFEQ